MSRRSRHQSQTQLTRYPSIEGPSYDVIDEPCIAFHKYDGSNLQFKWTQKDGWCQFGTRKRTINADNPIFGDAISLFMGRYADELLACIRRHKEYRNAKSLVAFCEFFGEHTFSGLHRNNEPKDLRLFDVYLPEVGFVLPFDFQRLFGHLGIAEVIYEGRLTKQFLNDIYSGNFPVKEGVVAKGVKTTQRRKGKTERETWMVKIKTKQWLDELTRRAGLSPELKQELEDNLKQQNPTIQNAERAKHSG